MNMSRGFVILLAFSTSFSFPENDVMHPVSKEDLVTVAVREGGRFGIVLAVKDASK